MSYALALTLFSLASFGQAGIVGHLGECSTSNNLLQVGTYMFNGDCNSQTYCAANGTCVYKGCRKDDFPFGYPQDSSLIPDKCLEGQFCPDEGDACLNILPVGSACQFNRDDQCEPPPNFLELRDITSRGTNVDGAVCLNNLCMWANATQGSSCVVENTAFIAYGPDGESLNIVSRGNCRVGLYCDSQDLSCKDEKAFGATCDADKECQSWNCQGDGTCGVPPATPSEVGVWVYVVVAVAILGGLFGVLFGLFFVHRKQRDTEREKRMQYWREQNAFHQNLNQMREAARASILSLPVNDRSARSSYVTDESGGLMQGGHQQKGSGLRHYMSDDGSSDYDEPPMRRDGDGRF